MSQDAPLHLVEGEAFYEVFEDGGVDEEGGILLDKSKVMDGAGDQDEEASCLDRCMPFHDGVADSSVLYDNVDGDKQ